MNKRSADFNNILISVHAGLRPVDDPYGLGIIEEVFTKRITVAGCQHRLSKPGCQLMTKFRPPNGVVDCKSNIF